MHRLVVSFLFYAIIFSCVYADVVQQYDITKAILHKNDINLPIPKQQQKHTILIIDLNIKQKDLQSRNAISLSIQQEQIKQKVGKNTQPFKYITLQNFATNKTQHINTQFGTLSLKQGINPKDSYIQIPLNMPLQSAMLLFHDNRAYLIGFDNLYEASTISETSLQDSKSLHVMPTTEYEISSWRYFLVLGIMIAILVVLYIIKLRQNRSTESSNIILEQAKILDSKNKVALIRHGDKRYLIGLNPHGITLLDTLQCDTQTEQANNNSPHKDTKEQSFMQLFLKRQ